MVQAKDISDFDQLRADDLVYRYRDLLESVLPKNPEDNRVEMAEAMEVRKELEDMGFKVSWQAEALIEDLMTVPPKVRVKVTLWLPKPGSDIVH